MTDRKEYHREYMRKKRAAKSVNKKAKGVNKSVNNSAPVNKAVNIDWQDQVDRKMFDGVGRGVPVNGYVMISRGRGFEDNDGIVTEEVWRARLGQTCEHGFEGWTCKRCL